MWKVREIADKVTNVVMNYTEIEAKVREATNDEAWGPTGALMQEIAHATFAYEHYAEVMGMLYRRLVATGDNRKYWRRVYKSLLLLHYLVRNGSERVVTSAREHLYDLRALESYTCVDEFNKDQGINIRHKAKDLIEFIQDDDRLREERKKAKKNKDKYIGMSSDGVTMSGFGPGSGDQWEDLPPAKDWSKEDDWDTDRVAGFEESENTSDNDVDDSSDVDNQSPPPPSTIAPPPIKPLGGSTSGKYTDTKKSTLSSPSKKSTSGLKKIDLGAAAHYGKDSGSQSGVSAGPAQGASKVSSDSNGFDLLGELITPEATPSKSTSNTDFGDFEAASFANSNVDSSKISSSAAADDFADFSSAFSSSSSTNVAASSSNPLSNSSSVAQSSNADLLSGLSSLSLGPSSLAMGPSTLPMGGPSSLTMGTSSLMGPSSLMGASSLPMGGAPSMSFPAPGPASFPDLSSVLCAPPNLPALLTLLNKHLPGPLTHAKLLGTDRPRPSFAEFSRRYSSLLAAVIPSLLEVTNGEIVLTRLIVIEDANVFTLDGALRELIAGIKRFERPCRNRDKLVETLVRLMRNEAVFLSLFCVDWEESDATDKGTLDINAKNSSSKTSESSADRENDSTPKGTVDKNNKNSSAKNPESSASRKTMSADKTSPRTSPTKATAVNLSQSSNSIPKSDTQTKPKESLKTDCQSNSGQSHSIPQTGSQTSNPSFKADTQPSPSTPDLSCLPIESRAVFSTADDLLSLLPNLSSHVSIAVKLDLPAFFRFLNVDKLVLVHLLNAIRISWEMAKADPLGGFDPVGNDRYRQGGKKDVKGVERVCETSGRCGINQGRQGGKGVEKVCETSGKCVTGKTQGCAEKVGTFQGVREGCSKVHQKGQDVTRQVGNTGKRNEKQSRGSPCKSIPESLRPPAGKVKPEPPHSLGGKPDSPGNNSKTTEQSDGRVHDSVKIPQSRHLHINTYLSHHLFNKLLSNFPIGPTPMGEHCRFLRKMLNIFHLWVLEDGFFTARLQSLLAGLGKRSLELLVTYMLKYVDDPLVCERLCERWMASKDFEALLAVKMVFQRQWSVLHPETDVVVRNLVHLLAKVSEVQHAIESGRGEGENVARGDGNADRKGGQQGQAYSSRDAGPGGNPSSGDELAVFRRVLMNALQLWSSYQVIVHSDLHQHAYLSKMIVNMVAWEPTLITPTEKYLLNGIMSHLKCTNEVLRTIGMICGDLILGMINECAGNPGKSGESLAQGVIKSAESTKPSRNGKASESSKTEDGPPKTIGFDYDCISPEAKAYVDSMKRIMVTRRGVSEGKTDKVNKDKVSRTKQNTGRDNSEEMKTENKVKGNPESTKETRTSNIPSTTGETNPEQSGMELADEMLLALLEEFEIGTQEVSLRNRGSRRKDSEKAAEDANKTDAHEGEKEQKSVGKKKTKRDREENVEGSNVASAEQPDSDDDASSTNSFLLDSDDEEYAEVTADAASSQNALASKVPKYLRDLKDFFTRDRSKETDNAAEVWIQTMVSAEKIIREQLPRDDVHVGLELLNIFVTMDPEFYFKAFERVRFNTILSILFVYPKQAAEYLATQFHAYGHQYSVRQKILLLDALSHSAHLLANPEEEQPEEASPTGKTDKSGKENLVGGPNAGSAVETGTGKVASQTKDVKSLGKDSHQPCSTDGEPPDVTALKEEILGNLVWRSRKLDLPQDESHGPGGAKLRVNHFANEVPWFFYPLIRGKTTRQDVFIPLKPREKESLSEFDEAETRRRQEDNMRMLEEIERSLAADNVPGDSQPHKKPASIGSSSTKPDAKPVSSSHSSTKPDATLSDISLDRTSRVLAEIKASIEDPDLKARNLQRKLDEFVIVRLIKSLSVILLASQHSIHNIPMCGEMLEFLAALSQDGARIGGVTDELKMAILGGAAAVLLSATRSRVKDLDLAWVGSWCVRILSESCERRVVEMGRRVLSLYVGLCEEVNGGVVPS
ncbi:hypothetical protein M8J77_002178 [Diaphorina citri]|nr:hypothetical protein M8J77_002178 [Diaphorina citri]